MSANFVIVILCYLCFFLRISKALCFGCVDVVNVARVTVVFVTVFQRQVEVSTVTEAYFQMLLKVCDNHVDVSLSSIVLGLYTACLYVTRWCSGRALDS